MDVSKKTVQILNVKGKQLMKLVLQNSVTVTTQKYAQMQAILFSFGA